MRIRRTGITLKPDSARVFFRPLDFTNRERILKITARVMALPEAETERRAQDVLREFANVIRSSALSFYTVSSN